MTYLVGSDLPKHPAGNRYGALLAQPGIARLPGAHNGMAALQAKAAGFEGLYLSGAAMSASMGLPDLGITTIEEVSFFIRQVARASGLPVLVDGDTGFGEALNVMHMVRSFEDAGAAAVHIEDQILPKKCGHLNDHSCRLSVLGHRQQSDPQIIGGRSGADRHDQGSGCRCTNVLLALSLGAALPGVGLIGAGAVVGFFGIGVSLVMFMLGLRHLRAARTGAHFSLAPFIGAILAVMIFRDAITVQLVLARLLMGLGLWLHLSDHDHAHEALEHDHAHTHDDHHHHTPTGR